MELSDKEKEIADKYVVDVKNTVYSNIFLILGFLIAVFYIQVFSSMLNEFTLLEMRVIGTFVFAYSVIKIVGEISQFNIEYKPR